ncbi:ABC-type multidrug transport system, ATPase component [Aciduliprofundum sp. MAR08-339]|nr:ABC-type multidrug transport system, ATPase component [Aciduliprofundum sp. MAR08-339]
MENIRWDPMNLLQVKNLKKTYSKWRHPVRALRGVSFSIERGEVVGLVGPNGAGKSTLIKIIVGFLREDGGRVELRTKKPIGYVQEYPTFFDSSVELNLKYIAELTDVPVENVYSLIEKFGLHGKEKINPSNLSKGQQKRLAIIRALIHNPDFMVMDEPFSGLDPSMAIGIRKIIEELKDKRKTIFISSHNLLYLTPVCDRVIFMNQGKIVGDYNFGRSVILKVIFKGELPEDFKKYSNGEEELLIETNRENIPGIIRELVNGNLDIYEAKIEGLDRIYERIYMGGEDEK